MRTELTRIKEYISTSESFPQIDQMPTLGFIDVCVTRWNIWGTSHCYSYCKFLTAPCTGMCKRDVITILMWQQNTRWLNSRLQNVFFLFCFRLKSPRSSELTPHVVQQYTKDLLLKPTICNHFLSTVYRKQVPESSPIDTPEQQRKHPDSKMVRYWSWRSDIWSKPGSVVPKFCSAIEQLKWPIYTFCRIVQISATSVRSSKVHSGISRMTGFHEYTSVVFTAFKMRIHPNFSGEICSKGLHLLFYPWARTMVRNT